MKLGIFAYRRAITIVASLLLAFQTIAMATTGMETTEKKKLRDETAAVFRKYVDIHQKFLSSSASGISGSGKSRSELNLILENYHEKEFLPKLETFTELVCADADRFLFADFVEVLLASQNSADESISLALGNIYLCQPELLIEAVHNLIESQKKFVYEQLAWGFSNATYIREDTIPNYQLLRKGLWQLLISISGEKQVDEITSVFKKHIQLNEVYNSSLASGASQIGKLSTKAREDCVNYYDKTYLPTLELFTAVVCLDNNGELVAEFFNVLNSPGNLLDERPAIVLGEIYLCQPNTVVETITKRDISGKRRLIELLHQGFERIMNGRDDRLSKYRYLKNQLDSMSFSTAK